MKKISLQSSYMVVPGLFPLQMSGLGRFEIAEVSFCNLPVNADTSIQSGMHFA